MKIGSQYLSGAIEGCTSTNAELLQGRREKTESWCVLTVQRRNGEAWQAELGKAMRFYVYYCADFPIAQ